MRKDTHSICIVIMVFLSAALIVMLVFESLHLSPRLSIGLEDLRAVTNGIILILAGLLWLTNLKRAEAISNEKRFENIVQSVGPDVLMVVDPKRRIVMCNESVEKMFGYEKEEIIGKKTDVLYGDRRANAKREQEIFKALDETGFHRGVAKGKTKGGKKVDLEIVTGKLRGSEGAVVLLRDITERKRLEGTIKRLNEDLDRRVVERTAELEKACTTLKQIDRVKDTFLSSVSHEFRTPLTSIRSFSEILLHYDDLEQEQSREFISIINLESERLSRMVNDVLDLAKIDAGKMEWNFKECRIDKVITSAVKGIHGLLLENDITLDMNVQSELRECIIDEDKIHQVVTNLLSNAIKFTPRGGRIRVQCNLDEDPKDLASRSGSVHLLVEDSGIGIPPDDISKIFDRFKQCGDTLVDKPKGTGLGLSICREIVSIHDGKIWAESALGKGSSFHVLLPLESSSHEEPEGDERKLTEDPFENKDQKKILIIQNQSERSNEVTGTLSKAGYRVEEANNSRVAMKKIGESEPDLIILDTGLGEVRNQRTAGKMMDVLEEKTMPVLMIATDEREARELGFQPIDWILKPVQAEELLSKVSNIINTLEDCVLVADDDPMFSEAIRYHLVRKGFSVRIALNGLDALNQIHRYRPSLILLKMTLPVLDGFKILEIIRDNDPWRDISIVAMSDLSTNAAKTLALKLGANAFYERTELQDLIQEITKMFTKRSQTCLKDREAVAL